MITLITGTPGAGKTAWIVQELTRLPTQRKLYVHGIPELKIAHEMVWCRSEHCDHCRTYDQQIKVEQEQGLKPLFLEEWPTWASHGSLIVADEVQRVWRPRSPGSKITSDIAKLETHRHMGLDFWLISQGPHLFDSNIRLLVGRHIHLVANWLGRKEFEWPECRQNLTSRADAVTRPYKLPKQIFGMYKSASLHTKLDKRRPLTFYAAIIAFLCVGFGSYYIVNKLKNAVTGKPSNVPTESSKTFKFDDVGSRLAAPASSNQNGFPDFKPEIEGVPESAPAYRSLIKVQSVPILAGCIKSQNACKCYTEQATPYPVTWEECLENVAHLKFNPYASSPGTTGPTSTTQTTPAPVQPSQPVQPTIESET